MKPKEFIRLLKLGQTKFKNLDIEGDFINENLNNLIFENCFFIADFTGSNLSNTVFTNCNLKTCIFDYSNMEHSSFNNNSLDGAEFKFAQYNHITFTDNWSYGCNFSNTILEQVIFEESPGFHIVNVHTGWFEVMLVSKEKKSIITASDYLGNDAPKQLLEVLCEMCECDNNDLDIERWICWDEEPGAYIWRLLRNDEKIKITVYIAKRDSHEIILEDRKSLEKEEIYNVDVEVEGNFYFFIKEVIKSFERIEKITGELSYEENWGDFPIYELGRLREAVRKKKNLS